MEMNIFMTICFSSGVRQIRSEWFGYRHITIQKMLNEMEAGFPYEQAVFPYMEDRLNEADYTEISHQVTDINHLIEGMYYDCQVQERRFLRKKTGFNLK